MEKKTTKKLIEEEFSINQKLGKYMEYAKAKCDISEKGARIRVMIPKLKEKWLVCSQNPNNVKNFFKEIDDQEFGNLIQMIQTCIKNCAKDAKEANENAKKAKGKSDSDHKSIIRNVIEESPTTKPKEKDKKSE